MIITTIMREKRIVMMKAIIIMVNITIDKGAAEDD